MEKQDRVTRAEQDHTILEMAADAEEMGELDLRDELLAVLDRDERDE